VSRLNLLTALLALVAFLFGGVSAAHAAVTNATLTDDATPDADLDALY
jgi:hypothetical protein